MSATVLLDAGPLGMATNPRSSVENELCKNWLSTLVYSGALVIIPEIADYEVRRELLRADKRPGIARLDALKALLAYEPITTPAMLRAAEFWSTARKMGKQSAADAALDADMIFSARDRARSRPIAELFPPPSPPPGASTRTNFAILASHYDQECGGGLSSSVPLKPGRVLETTPVRCYHGGDRRYR